MKIKDQLILIKQILKEQCRLKQLPVVDTRGLFKSFFGYISKTNAFIIPLYIKIPQINVYVKYFNDNKKNDKRFNNRGKSLFFFLKHL